MTGKLNPESEGEGKSRTITAEAKLGSVKFEKIDWFSSLKFKQPVVKVPIKITHKKAG